MKKKVVLIGDSIRQIGYGTILNQYLDSNEYDIWQSPDNDMFVKFTLRKIWDEKSEIENADIVHWNNGLWDICKIFDDGKPFSSLEEYIDNTLRVADFLLKHAKKVIFATTTPVNPNHPYNDNETIIEFNNAVVPLLKEKGIIINDLFGLVYPRLDEYIADDLIHLSEKGKIEAAKQVARIIKENC